jgi:hypothetical protein
MTGERRGPERRHSKEANVRPKNQVVEFVDALGRTHPALVRAVHGDEDAEDPPSVNLVYLDPNEGATDSYGCQLVNETSVVHESSQSAHGMFWRRPAA